MGLISFAKNAGKKILRLDDDDSEAKDQPVAATPAAQAAPAPPAAQTPAVEAPAAAPPASDDAGQAEAAAGERLGALVAELGLGVENLSVQVHGDTATVTGTAQTQADREKIVLVVGNTAGIAQVDDQLQVQEPAPEAIYYEVKSGDTLSAIAEQFYGDASKYPVIFEANQPMLDNPDLIYPGQSLRIPPL